MFSKEQEVRHHVKVIGVTVTRNLKAKSISVFNSYEHIHIVAPFTTVLYTIDGVLETKDFDGVWTLTQCKNWTADRYLR